MQVQNNEKIKEKRNIFMENKKINISRYKINCVDLCKKGDVEHG